MSWSSGCALVCRCIINRNLSSFLIQFFLGAKHDIGLLNQNRHFSSVGVRLMISRGPAKTGDIRRIPPPFRNNILHASFSFFACIASSLQIHEHLRAPSRIWAED